MIPDFDADGMLPAGDYPVTFDQLRNSMLVLGPTAPKDCVNWQAAWRSHLVDNLEILVMQLWSVGVLDVYADGSFVENKDHPNDIDGYFKCDLALLASGELQRQLNLIDPHKVWTWRPDSRRPFRGYPKLQLPMWHRYRVELYPHVPGMGCGIRDEHGMELEFPSAFRRSRSDGRPRGILKLEP